MRKQIHRQPLFDTKVKYERTDRWGNKEQREYTRKGRVGVVLRKVTSWFGQFFKSNKQIQALDLRPDPSRGHGAMVLRAWWPALVGKKLRSTRDGRAV